MPTVATIQARMGSSRLPGKVMLPLDCAFVLEHVVRRVNRAEYVDETVVATSTERSDDIIARFAPEIDAHVYRGSESDVLERLFEAARLHDAESVVRITADCPLIDPAIIDAAVARLQSTDADYCSNISTRTFPRGLDVETFTFDSFERVNEDGTERHHREHVTPYYREHLDEFDLANVVSNDVYDDPQLVDRTDLRFTLDVAEDYELLSTIYRRVPYDDVLAIEEVVRFVDDHGLADLNASIEQKEVRDAYRDPG